MRLTGIEIAPEAIACAKQSAAQLGLSNLHFQALDSTQFATGSGYPAGAGQPAAPRHRRRTVRLFKPHGAALYYLFQL
jgi:hypothetical protein